MLAAWVASAPISSIKQQAPAYVDRILRGAKPADLPVQAPVNTIPRERPRHGSTTRCNAAQLIANEAACEFQPVPIIRYAMSEDNRSFTPCSPYA